MGRSLTRVNRLCCRRAFVVVRSSFVVGAGNACGVRALRAAECGGGYVLCGARFGEEVGLFGGGGGGEGGGGREGVRLFALDAEGPTAEGVGGAVFGENPVGDSVYRSG
jgi:hypothetical protein